MTVRTRAFQSPFNISVTRFRHYRSTTLHPWSGARDPYGTGGWNETIIKFNENHPELVSYSWQVDIDYTNTPFRAPDADGIPCFWIVQQKMAVVSFHQRVQHVSNQYAEVIDLQNAYKTASASAVFKVPTSETYIPAKLFEGENGLWRITNIVVDYDFNWGLWTLTVDMDARTYRLPVYHGTKKLNYGKISDLYTKTPKVTV